MLFVIEILARDTNLQKVGAVYSGKQWLYNMASVQYICSQCWLLWYAKCLTRTLETDIKRAL